MATDDPSAAISGGKPLHFYAKALDERGHVAQLLVTKEPGKPTKPEWTGKIYKSDREADRDIAALNVAIARGRAAK